MSIKALKNKV